MRRFSAALVLSLALHALLFYSDLTLPAVQKPDVRLPRHLTIHLSYRLPPPEPEPIPPALSIKKPEPPPSVPKPARPRAPEPVPATPKPQREKTVYKAPVKKPAEPAEAPPPPEQRNPKPPKPVHDAERAAPEIKTPVFKTPPAVVEKKPKPNFRPSEIPRGAKSQASPSPPAVPQPAPLKTARPAYRENPPPPYPRSARRRGLEGTVLLEVFVSPRGDPEKIKLLESSGHRVLDRAALSAVRTWVFEPGTMGDRPVGMWVRVPIRFELR